MDRHYTENGPIHSRQLFAVLAMLWVKLVNLVNFVMQIFDESLKSLMSNFATSATFASANFVGKASSESTVMYRVKSRITSTCLRHSLDSHLYRFSLASLICLCMLTVGVGNTWGTDATFNLWQASAPGSPTTNNSVSFAYSGCVFGSNSANSGFNVNGQVVATMPDGATVTQIVVYKTSNSWAQKANLKVYCGNTLKQTITQPSGNVTITLTGTEQTAGSYKFKNEGSNSRVAYVQKIVITYTASACSAPTVGSALTSVSTTTNSITATVPISATGGCNITENGLVYSTSVATPTVGAANCTKVTTTACGGTAANKEVTITGLACGTTYYVRGYATNSSGTSYTNVKTQATSDCPLYTVTLMDDSDTRTQASYGASVTLPSRTGCSGYTFAGWTKSWVAEQSSWTSTAPTIIDAGSYTPAADENLYPVYTKTESGSGFSSYTKVTSAQSDWSGKYLISDGTLTATGSKFSSTALEVTTLTPGTTEYTSYEFTITKNGNNSNYFIITPDGTNYVGYSGSSAGLAFTTSTPASNNYLWTCSTSDPMTLNVGTNTRYIGVGIESATSVFKAYSTSGTNAKCYLYKRIEGGSTTYYISVPDCCTRLGSITGTFTSSNLSQSSGVLTATLPSASKNANATSYRFTLYDNSDVEITHTDVATGGGDVSTTFSSPNVTAGNTYKVSVTPLVSPQGSYCSTTGTESDKASITMHYTVTLAVNNAEYGSISPTSTLYVASGTSISASTNTLSVGATNITATYSDPTAQYTYGFTNWTWSPSGSSITANTTATANFSRSTRTYNVTTTGITHATASPAIPATVAYGGSISTTITADANYSLPSVITVTGATLDSWNSSTGALSITDVTGDVSITITAVTAMKRIYMNTDGTAEGKWGKDSPKFFVHSWGSSDDDAELVAQPCASNVFYADIPAANTTLLFTRQDPSKGSSIIYKGNDGNWGQSVDITISTNNYFTFNGNWDVSSTGKSGFDAGTYTPDMKTIYLSFCAEWLEDNPLFALYDVTHSTWMSTFAEAGTGCYAGYYIAQVPSCAETVLIGRFKPGTPAPFGWSGENWWGQSVNFTIGSDTYDKITIEGWGTEGDAKDKGYGSLGNFALTQYSISFAGGGGTGSMSSLTNKDCGSDVALSNVDFTKTGYNFDGWHADVDVKVGGATVPAGSTIANQATIQDIRSNVALTAQWVAKEYTITLDREGASTGSESVTMTYNSSSHTAITAPTKTGYNFGGWYSGDNGTGSQVMNASGVLQANVDGYTGAGGVWTRTTTPTTLYAKWIAKEYTITLDREGAASGATSVTATFDAGTLTGWSAPSKTGYSFGGYWSGDNGTGTLVISTTGVLQNSVTISAVNWTDGSGHWVKDGGVAVYAKWTANVYNITYKDQGDVAYSGNATAGVPTGAPTTHTYGSATALVNGVKDGYRFDGWFTDASCTVSAGSSIGATAMTADFTLYAKWTQVYTVTWSVNGDTWESGVVEGNTHVPGGSKVSALPTAPTSSDCDDSKVFVGWRAAAIDGTSVSDPSGIFTNVAGSPTIDADKTFYAVFADVSGGDVIEFKLPFDNKATCGVNNYTSSWVAEIDDYSWTISNFNNNNFSSGWTTDIRCGRNGNASIASITTDAAISFRVDSVYINLTATNDSYINSAKLQISSSSGISTPDEINIPVNKTGVKGLKITSPAKDKYYRVIFDCKSYTANGFVRIGSIVYKQKLDTANYVTSCSSCDADATFTNEAPKVSEIGCTSATLTMEDGLGTLGADGCHVSDYGFVIGTADNPAIGGSGVEKLQVGTSDPTIGEDFSFDATGLTKGTHYYIRAYAINRHGTAYSSSQNFWTKDVSSIAITTAPTKTNYIVGETFDATGMVVTATMASGATEDVTSDVTYSSSALTAGTSQNFAINYSLCETVKSVNQVINVYTLTVNEGTNPGYGTATNSSANIVSITGLGDHKTYTVTVTSSNATAVDNGDNTWSIINATGNVTVTVDYADAVQVKVYYKVDGVTVTGLTRDVYQSETTTLPTASDLATAMTAQGMDLPDDDYPNFVGWSETEFGAQTSEPTLVTGTPTINAEKTYYAVYTNLNRITIIPSDFSTGYPSSGSADGTKTFGGKNFGWNYLLNGNVSSTNLPLQFKKNSTEYGRLYNTDPLNYILRVEIGYYDATSNVPVYVASSAGTISGGALTPASRESTNPYVYTMPASTSYFYIKGDNSTVYKIRSVDIYYSPATVYYMTQFCTRYTITGASTSGTAVTGGTLTSSANSLCSGKSLTLSAAVTDGYAFEGWTITGASSGDMTSTLLGANASSVTPPAFTMPAENLTVSATITEKKVTGWTFTNHIGGAEITSTPIVVYVDQKVQLDIAYSPEPLLSSHKANTQYDYTRSDDDSYIKSPSKATDKFSFIGKASTNGTTTSITLTHNDDSDPATFAKTINVEVRALPTDKFLDLVHGVVFADQSATLTTSEGVANGGVVFTYTAPGSDQAEWTDEYANTCEQKKVKLVGWVESEYADACIAADSFPTTDALKADSEHFFAVGATMTASNKTYYAVWAEIE